MIKFLKCCIFMIISLLCLLLAGYVFVLPEILPKDYDEYISKYANVYDIEEELVYAVIFTESRFLSNAVSSAGAVGLMQVTPETGDWIKGHLGITEEIELTDPETNINFGCWYLSWLGEKFDGNEKNMLAGYNAGHNRVSLWLDDKEYSSNGEDLTYIPYPETASYVEKVAFTKELYRILYGI